MVLPQQQFLAPFLAPKVAPPDADKLFVMKPRPQPTPLL